MLRNLIGLVLFLVLSLVLSLVISWNGNRNVIRTNGPPIDFEIQDHRIGDPLTSDFLFGEYGKSKRDPNGSYTHAVDLPAGSRGNLLITYHFVDSSLEAVDFTFEDLFAVADLLTAKYGEAHEYGIDRFEDRFYKWNTNDGELMLRKHLNGIQTEAYNNAIDTMVDKSKKDSLDQL